MGAPASRCWARSWAAAPPATAISHQHSTRKPADRMTPVKRFRMEVVRVYLNLYTPRCGDSGRLGIRSSEIDTAPVPLPVAVAGGFRASRAADLAQRCAVRGAGRRLRSCAGGDLGSGLGSLAIGHRHTHLVCQNSRPATTKRRGKTTLNMHTPWHSVPLDSLGVLRARGPDVRKFLQGQLSNDMTRLAPERALLAAYHNV